jgi:hypothetical protein
MIVVRTDLPKLCHARPGDVVQIVDTEGDVEPSLYLVCVFPVKGKRAGRGVELINHGLYDEERPLFLVDIETGISREMPHLSNRVQIRRDVRVEVKA